MSNVLIIRHLPQNLTFQEKERFLKHFGAEKVWETAKKRNYVFASFNSPEKAKASLHKLHQLEIAKRRIVVEYSLEKEPVCNKQDIDKSSAVTQNIQGFLRLLNAWNPSVDFYQPPPVHIKYKYPEVSPSILVNIVHALLKHKSFYVQTLHLMNKMSLESPFENNERALQLFIETFRHLYSSEIQILSSIPHPESEPESELSGEESEQKSVTIPTFKRKHKLAAPHKTPAAVLSTATLPKVRKVAPTNQEDVFEASKIQEPKKISVVVNQDALQKPAEEPEVVGELGKFHIEPQPEPPAEFTEPEQPTITKKELLRNKISYSDMKVLPVFKNYHPGEPSMRLYIKNLAKTVTEPDVKRIYKRYVEKLTDEELIGFDVRVMQEGRMKGQAFVTFPSVAAAETALHETNGYLLKEKPMVVQFARAANKKSID